VEVVDITSPFFSEYIAQNSRVCYHSGINEAPW